MSFDLRNQIEKDLSVTLEREYGLPIILYGPDGLKQDKSALEPNEDLLGQVQNDTITQNPETGETIITNNPVISVRRRSLIRIPLPGEKWAVQIPITPDRSGAVENFIFSPTRAPEGGSSIGFIILYLRRAKDSAEVAELIFQDTVDSEFTDDEDTEWVDS